MWLSTVEIGVANGNPIRYGCRAGAKTIRDSWTQLNGSLLLSTCQLIKHLQLSYHPNLFLRCEILILLFRECYAIVGSCFSASLATKLANKLKEKVLSKTASVWRSCKDLPLLCYLLSCATAAWLHDNRPKRELARGQEVAWPTCRCRICKRVKCYNHRLFCFTVQNVLIKKRGNLLTPAPN